MTETERCLTFVQPQAVDAKQRSGQAKEVAESALALGVLEDGSDKLRNRCAGSSLIFRFLLLGCLATACSSGTASDTMLVSLSGDTTGTHGAPGAAPLQPPAAGPGAGVSPSNGPTQSQQPTGTPDPTTEPDLSPSSAGPVPLPPSDNSPPPPLLDAGAAGAGAGEQPDSPNLSESPNPPDPPDASASPIDSDAGAQPFDIELSFDTEAIVDERILEAFRNAEQRWESVIIGDLPDVSVGTLSRCNGYPLPSDVDDLIIFVTIASLDGPQGLLGAAAPCAIRSGGTGLPFAGAMEFDADDLMVFAESGRLEEVVLHEMGHVLGIGSLWQGLDLLSNPSDGTGVDDTAFNGAASIAAFDSVGGYAYVDGAKVPVENLGSEGQINGHWRESVLGNELMTSAIGAQTAKLSAVTIASLLDLGYEVSMAAADDYQWPAQDDPFALRTLGTVTTGAIDLSADRLDLPLIEVNERGEARALHHRGLHP